MLFKKPSSLQCSCSYRVGMLHHVCSPPMKQYNLVLAGSVGRGNFMAGRCCLIHQAVPVILPMRTRQPCNSKSLKPCRAKSDDSTGGTLSGESIILNEQSLERELQLAIDQENYAQAAKIRDTLKLLQEDGKTSVLAANARFYNAFRNGDLAAMQGLWSRGENVCVVHPGVSGISGYDLVMGSWEFVWADYDFPLEIEIEDVEVHIRGDLGYVNCVEKVKTKSNSWGRQFATNVFERIDGQWFICIHHASYIDL